MQRLHYLAAILTGVLAAAVTAGGQTPAGSIVGRVTLTTRVRGTPLPSPMYPARHIGRQGAPSIPEIRNVVVYLKGVMFRGELPVTRAQLTQQDETFIPHVLAITKGSSVDFPNDDPYFHNVFSLSGAGTFDLGRYPQGQTRTQRFSKAGLVKVYCHIHSHMTASILVLDHPYFTIPGTGGAFELRGVPAGQYTVVGWHERVGERTTTVSVESGKPTTVNLSLPVEEAP